MVNRIDPLQAHEALRSQQPPRLLDVRTTIEYELAHIEGSTFIPMDEIAARMSELDPDTHWVVVCHHGYRSMQVAMWLQSRGFESVSNLEGGIDRWSLEVDTEIPRY